MTKEKIHKFLYAISALLIVAFVIRLGVDYFKYNTYLNSASFYIFVIVRVVEFIVPSTLFYLVAAALQKKRVEQTKEIEELNPVYEFDASAFKRHGFFKVTDHKKKICVMVNQERYEFDYETNVIYEIPKGNIKFAMCMHAGPRARRLFVNKDYAIVEGTTSPYRTFYEGLMKEPFRFCYPFDESAIIVTKKKDKLRFWVESK